MFKHPLWFLLWCERVTPFSNIFWLMCQFPSLEHRDQRVLENSSFPHRGLFLVFFLELRLPEVFPEENCKSHCSVGHLPNLIFFSYTWDILEPVRNQTVVLTDSGVSQNEHLVAWTRCGEANEVSVTWVWKPEAAAKIWNLIPLEVMEISALGRRESADLG